MGTAVVRDLERARAVGPYVGQSMDGGRAALDFRHNLAVASGSVKGPSHVLPIAQRFLYPSKLMRLTLMPEDSLAEAKSEWHLICKCFQRGDSSLGLREAGVHPCPELSMTEPAIVPLHARAEGLALKKSLTATDLAVEDAVGMRCARKPDPAFVA